MKNKKRNTSKRALISAGIIIAMLNFIRIDIDSHSVSDTLLNFIPQTLALAFIVLGIYGFIQAKNNR